MEEKPKIFNAFIAMMNEFKGREVKVYYYTPKGIQHTDGLCEGIDHNQKAVIVRTKTDTHLIPRYLYMTRPRSHPDGKITKTKEERK